MKTELMVEANTTNLAGELLKRETLDAQTFKDLMKQSPVAA
jgi:ATP-dependent Zn protease